MKINQEKQISHFMRGICKNKSTQELRQAELNYLRFLKLAEKISSRLANEKKQIS